MPPIGPRKRCARCRRLRRRRFFPWGSAECDECVNEVVERRDHEEQHAQSLAEAEAHIARVRKEAGL